MTDEKELRYPVLTAAEKELEKKKLEEKKPPPKKEPLLGDFAPGIEIDPEGVKTAVAGAVGVVVIVAVVFGVWFLTGIGRYSLWISTEHSAPHISATYLNKKHCEDAAMDIMRRAYGADQGSASAWCNR
jgi:hypothetical protein